MKGPKRHTIWDGGSTKVPTRTFIVIHLTWDRIMFIVSLGCSAQGLFRGNSTKIVDMYASWKFYKNSGHVCFPCRFLHFIQELTKRDPRWSLRHMNILLISRVTKKNLTSIYLPGYWLDVFIDCSNSRISCSKMSAWTKFK